MTPDELREANRKLYQQLGAVEVNRILNAALAKPQPSPFRLPKGWRNWSEKRKKATRVAANSPGMIRIGSWFKRREDTLWSVYEAGTLADLKPTMQEVEIMEKYYTARRSDELYRRHDLATLLNNWNGELDRARMWHEKNQKVVKFQRHPDMPDRKEDFQSGKAAADYLEEILRQAKP